MSALSELIPHSHDSNSWWNIKRVDTFWAVFLSLMMNTEWLWKVWIDVSYLIWCKNDLCTVSEEKQHYTDELMSQGPIMHERIREKVILVVRTWKWVLLCQQPKAKWWISNQGGMKFMNLVWIFASNILHGCWAWGQLSRKKNEKTTRKFIKKNTCKGLKNTDSWKSK